MGICEYFGLDKLADFTENKIIEIKEAQKAKWSRLSGQISGFFKVYQV